MKHALSVLPLVTAVSLGLTASARAATQTVTNLNDSGTGSLRTAITAAASGDTVVFQSGLNGTITLASVLPTISKNLTIQGPGASIITVSGANLYRVFNIGSVVVNVSGITIANGSVASGNGAGISSSSGGTLTISNSVITGNTTPNSGGAIAFTGSLTITNSVISGNHATGSAAIFSGGNLTVDNTTFSGNTLTTTTNNYGGAITFFAASPSTVVNISRSTFSGNQAQAGGAIYVAGNTLGTYSITNSTFAFNTATAGAGAGIWINNTTSGIVFRGGGK